MPEALCKQVACSIPPMNDTNTANMKNKSRFRNVQYETSAYENPGLIVTEV